jgi:hypothetical protein
LPQDFEFKTFPLRNSIKLASFPSSSSYPVLSPAGLGVMTWL